MIKYLLSYIVLALMNAACTSKANRTQVFDVHLHGDAAPEKQLRNLSANGVRAIAISTSWAQQQTYQSNKDLTVLHGLLVPCPNGKVPYSLQTCFEDGNEWPDVNWVEQQIKEKKIDFIGEVLTQYHGISSSDTLMHSYYALAERYNLPVGIHTGSAGPDHGCANFKEEMGDPLLLKDVLRKFPKLKI